MRVRSIARSVVFIVAAAGVVACGDDDGSEDCGTDNCCDGTCTGSGGATGDGGANGTGGGGASDVRCGLAAVERDDHCGDVAPLDCGDVEGGDAYVLCSVPLADPSSSAGADAACFGAPSYPPPPPAATGTTRMQGFVRIFANGCQSRDVTVEVFTVDEDGELGARVGTSATTPASCIESGEVTPNEACDGGRYECAYVYPNLPTETLLAVRTSGPQWTPVIDYAVFIRNEDAASGSFSYDPHVVAIDDYGVIAQAAIGRPISPDRGAIVGEVRDCAEAYVSGAIVGTDTDAVGLAYFTNDEDDPLPDRNARATGTFGRFAALDVAAGPARVVAAAEVDGVVTSLGHRDVRVFPETITWVDLSGPLPTQQPAD